MVRYSSQCLKRGWVVERGEKHGQRFDFEDYFYVECRSQAGFQQYHCLVTDFYIYMLLSANKHHLPNPHFQLTPLPVVSWRK